MWVLFNKHGCLCNPAVNHGTPGHVCTLIIQLALLITQDNTPATIPWNYRAVDLMDVLEPVMSGPALTRVSVMMMARQFEALLLSPDLHRLLSSQCLRCDEAVPLHRALEHARLAHGFDVKCLTAIIEPLAKMACDAHPHTDFWCEHCGILRHYDAIV